MGNGSEAYLDLILEFHSLAFFTLGIVAFLATRREGGTRMSAHVGCLATFAVLQALAILGNASYPAGTLPWQPGLGVVLASLGFIALLEYGRRLWNSLGNRFKLAATPLYMLLGTSVLVLVVQAPAPLTGLDVGLRYLVAAPGTLLAALGLLSATPFTAREPGDRSARLWLGIGVVAMLGYGILNLFATTYAPNWPAWLPNATDFVTATGLPLQLPLALCILAMAVVIAVMERRANQQTIVTLRRVTNNLNGFVYRCRNDRDYAVTFMSDGAEPLTGYPAEAFLQNNGLNFGDFIHPDDQAQVWEQVQAALAERRDFQASYRIVDRQGVARWCFEQGRGIFDEQGQLLYLEGYVRNDVARREAENVMRKLQQLVDFSPQPIAWFSPGGPLGYANAAMQRMLGLNINDIAADYSFSDFCTPDTVKALWSSAIPTTLELGRWTGEFEVQSLDGRIIPTLHSIFTLPDSNGDATEIAVVATELTELKHTEQALQREHDFAANLVKSAPGIILLLDTTGKIKLVNPYFERLSGYRLEEIQGRDWVTTFVPPREHERIRKTFFSALAEQPVHGNVTPIVVRNGEEYSIQWNAQPLRAADGTITGLLSTGVDVTERIRAQAALQQSERELNAVNESLEQRVRERTNELQQEVSRNTAILGSTLEGFFAADCDGHLTHVNQALCAMLGYTEAELLTMTITDIEANEKPEETAAHIRKILREKHDRFDTRHRRRDGTEFDVEISVSLITSTTEPVLYVFVRDITQRKVTEGELIQARDIAESANAAKSEFLSRMSHELRTPLNAIIGFSQLLLSPSDKPLSTQQMDNLLEISTASEHLLEMVNRILKLAPDGSRRTEVNLESLSVAQVANHCIERLRQLAEVRDIQIIPDLDASLFVQGERSRVEQVLLDLLSNAIKYNREHGSVRLAARITGNYVRTEIRDTGRGLSTDQKARLFKPFERMESAYNGIGGAGVGLALTKQLVQEMGGEIGADSTMDAGSTFWFTLPLARSSKGASLVPAKFTASGALSAATTPGEAGFTILHIEDNPANLKLVRKLIGTRERIQLVDATSAEAGLELAFAAPPGLILLDINLPGMDGFAALKQLKAEPATATVPVIAITANAMARDVEDGKAAGFADYLTKPLNINHFVTTIDRYLEGHEISGGEL